MNNSFFSITSLSETYPNYSSWQPQSSINNNIQKNAKITSNWEYRQYMQHNSNQIMKYNSMEAINASGNNPYQDEKSIVKNISNDNSNNVPYLYKSMHDNNKSLIEHNSDLKQDYIKKMQFQSRLVAPSLRVNNK